MQEGRGTQVIITCETFKIKQVILHHETFCLALSPTDLLSLTLQLMFSVIDDALFYTHGLCVMIFQLQLLPVQDSDAARSYSEAF